MLIGTKRSLLWKSFSFDDNFNRANGGLGSGWTGATWTIASNKAINTPTKGAEQLENFDFSAWTDDDPDNWAVSNEDVNNYITENPGGKANLVSDTTAAVDMINAEAPGVGVWIRSAIEAVTVSAGKWRVIIDNLVPSNNWIGTGTGTIVITGRATGNTNFIIRRDVSGASNIIYDDATLKPLTLSTLFASIATSQTNVIADVDIVLAGGITLTEAGLVLCLDDASSPANFLIAYHDGTKAHLDKCVAGTYTSLINTTTTYSSGATLKVIKSGTSVSLYYNGSQVSTTQTVSDASIINNIIHGLFSTYSGNTLDNYSIR